MSKKKISMSSSIFWNTFGSIFYLGCQWLMTILVVRLSNVTNAGILSLAMSVCNIWYCIAVYGMRNFQVSDTNAQYLDSTYIFSRFLSTGSAAIGCLAYTFIMPYDLKTSFCILFFFVYKSSEALFDVYAGIFQKEWRLDYAGKSMILRGILTLTIFSVILYFTNDLPITIIVMALSCFLSLIFYDIPIAHKTAQIKMEYRFNEIKDLFIKCSPLVLYTFLSTAIGSIPKLFLEQISGSYKLGIYSSVATPTLIIQMGATYIFNPFVTLFAEYYLSKDKKRFLNILKKCFLAVFLIAIAGIIGGQLFGVWGLKILYGNEIAKYSTLLIPLIICTILTAFSWLLCGILTATRQFYGLVISNVIAVLSSVILSPALERIFDMQGASLALAVSTILEIFILMFYLFKDINSI